MLGGFYPGQPYPGQAPNATIAVPHTETVSQHGVVVFEAPFTAPTFRSAPRVEEVYVEAVTRAAAVARLDEVYVEVWTKEGWRGWGIVL